MSTVMTVLRTAVVSYKRLKRQSYFLLQFCQVRTGLVAHESNHIQAFQSYDEILCARDDVRGHVYGHVYGRVSHVGCHGGYGHEYHASSSQ